MHILNCSLACTCQGRYTLNVDDWRCMNYTDCGLEKLKRQTIETAKDYPLAKVTVRMNPDLKELALEKISQLYSYM